MEAAQCGTEGFGGLKALVRILRHGHQNDFVHALRQIGANFNRWLGRLFQMGGEDGEIAVGLKRALPGHHLIERNANRVQV